MREYRLSRVPLLNPNKAFRLLARAAETGALAAHLKARAKSQELFILYYIIAYYSNITLYHIT